MNVRRVLEIPVAYKLLTTLVGGSRSRRRFVQSYIQPRERDRVLDIGCGPADILEYLPAVRYVGFDANEAYIAAATRRYGERGDFHCAVVSQEQVAEHDFDIVLALGVVHHLDDAEAAALFRLARRTLRPGGKLVTLDGVYLDKQSWPERFMLSKDRGRFVRAFDQYRGLAAEAFPEVRTDIVHDLIWPFPYAHLIMECRSDASSAPAAAQPAAAPE